MSVGEYRVTVRVQNNLLLSAIEGAGYSSQSDFARAADLSVTAVNALVGLRDAPIRRDGSFSETATKIMEVLGACPSDLWTEEQMMMKLRRSTSSRALGREEIESILLTGKSIGEIETSIEKAESEVFRGQIKKALDEAMSDGTLTEREGKVLLLRYGIGRTEAVGLEEVGKQFDVTRERVRQIEVQATEKLRPRFAGFIDG